MRTTRKPEILLELLSRNETTLFTYDQLAFYLKLSYRRTQRILCSLQEQGKVRIEKSLLNNRRHLVTLPKESRMARLRKREIIEPVIDRTVMKQSLRKTMNARKRKKKNDSPPLLIPPSILKIIKHWNDIEYTRSLKIPDPVNGLYPDPTAILKETVGVLKKVITGRFFSTVPIYEISEMNQPFTADEIIEVINRFADMAFSKYFLPYNKYFLQKKTLSEVIYYEYGSLESLSWFMHLYHNPPELTPANKAQEIKMDGIQKLQEIERDEVELLTLEWDLLNEWEKRLYPLDEKEKADLKRAAMVLHDFAEEHGGIMSNIGRWVGYAIEALKWRKEKGGKFKITPQVLLKDWFYTGIIIDYLVDTEQDRAVYLPEIHGEDVPAPPERVLTEEEAKKLWPYMYRHDLNA